MRKKTTADLVLHNFHRAGAGGMVSKRGRKFSELSYLNGWPRSFLSLYLIGIDPTIFHLNPATGLCCTPTACEQVVY